MKDSDITYTYLVIPSSSDVSMLSYETISGDKLGIDKTAIHDKKPPLTHALRRITKLTSPSRSFSKVDLPAPLGPTSAILDSRSMPKSILL